MSAVVEARTDNAHWNAPCGKWSKTQYNILTEAHPYRQLRVATIITMRNLQPIEYNYGVMGNVCYTDVSLTEICPLVPHICIRLNYKHATWFCVPHS